MTMRKTTTRAATRCQSGTASRAALRCGLGGTSAVTAACPSSCRGGGGLPAVTPGGCRMPSPCREGEKGPAPAGGGGSLPDGGSTYCLNDQREATERTMPKPATAKAGWKPKYFTIRPAL